MCVYNYDTQSITVYHYTKDSAYFYYEPHSSILHGKVLVNLMLEECFHCFPHEFSVWEQLSIPQTCSTSVTFKIQSDRQEEEVKAAEPWTHPDYWDSLEEAGASACSPASQLHASSSLFLPHPSLFISFQVLWLKLDRLGPSHLLSPLESMCFAFSF